MRLCAIFAIIVTVLGGISADAFAQNKKSPAVKGAVMLKPAVCMRMCEERGYAASQSKSCKHLCRPGCRNAATGELFCVVATK